MTASNIMTYKKIFYIAAIFAIIEMVLLFTLCSHEPEINETIIHDTIPGDSIPYELITEKPVPVYIDTGSSQFWYLPVDTAAILKDYFAKAIYMDTLMNDTSAFIAIMDTVYMNRLQSRKLYFANRRPTLINTTIYTQSKQDDKLKVYAGAMVALMPDRTLGGPAVIIATNNGAGSYAYGINTKTHVVTFVYRLRLRP